MKRLKKLGKRILSMCLCISLLLGMFPMTAMADNAPEEITIETLEGLAEPTEFPAEGTIHLYVLKEVAISQRTVHENYVDSFEDVYLPVIVDQNKKVYAKLSELQGHLRMRVDATTNDFGNQVRIVRYYNSALYLTEKDVAAVYTMYIHNGYKDQKSIYPNVEFSLGTAPLMYKDEFYVPLDAFLQCTGSFAFYEGENDIGKQDLYVIPPQETVLDHMLAVCVEADSYYAFNFQKDIGLTYNDVNEQYHLAEGVQYIHRFGKIFDAGAWSMSFGSDKYFDDKYIDLYMDHVLHASEEILNKGWDVASTTTDVGAFALDVTELAVSKAWKKTTVVSRWLLDHYKDRKHLYRVREYSNNAGLAVSVVGSALNYWSICASLYGADQISVNGAELLSGRYKSWLDRNYLNEQNYKRIQKDINDYGDRLGLHAFGRWVEEYWMSTGMTFAKILTDKLTKVNGILGVVGVASSIWSGGTSLVFKEHLDSTESFMAACLGQQYQYEVLPSITRALGDYIMGSMENEEDVRSILYHALASCYAARYLGCEAMKDQLIYYPEKLNEQKHKNENIEELLAVLQCSSIPMGMNRHDFWNLDYNEELHYKNVYFNICQIQGRIHNLEGKPVGNLEVWIGDEKGALLKEFKTNKAGDFDISFPVEDVNIFEDGELQKEITFHIEYKNYPEILETVEIPIFKKVKVNGLWAGRYEETILCYLEDANEVLVQDKKNKDKSQVVLDIRRINIIGDRDKIFNMEAFSLFGVGNCKTYILRSKDYVLADSIEKIPLEDGRTFQTAYSVMYPDGTWAGEMMQLFSGVGFYDEDYAFDVLMNSDMHDPNEIYEYIEHYGDIVGDYPAYEITKINSEIQTIEPIILETY